ncbi:MAG: MOSC domain-containing protein [Ilumatobacteraceae bacterium]
MIHLGPYTFTNQDALRTMGNLGGLWASMMEGRTSAGATAAGDALRARSAEALGLEQNATLAEVGARGAHLPSRSPLLGPLLADVWQSLRDASDALRADGQMPERQAGIVTQLSRSGGGVPKLAVDAVDVDFGGVVGDIQRVRVHHGRPWQALCLFADEVIDQFRTEGHPIQRGSVGENISVSGLDWALVRPGVRIRVGTVVGHVQAFAEPCRSNAQFFVGGDFQRMNIDRGPVSRVYATVLEPGRIATGDTIELEPDLA